MNYFDKYRALNEDYSKRYDELEADVIADLIELVEKHGVKSKHMNEKAIDVTQDSSYHELALLNGKLIFLNQDGLQYSLHNNSLNDLIHLLTDLKKKFS